LTISQYQINGRPFRYRASSIEPLAAEFNIQHHIAGYIRNVCSITQFEAIAVQNGASLHKSFLYQIRKCHFRSHTCTDSEVKRSICLSLDVRVSVRFDVQHLLLIHLLNSIQIIFETGGFQFFYRLIYQKPPEFRYLYQFFMARILTKAE